MSKLEPTRTYSNPTAAEVLRRLLDECGVEYDTDDEDGCEFTEWVANGLEWEADSRGELVSLMPVMLITPEQAIAATLGSCNCTNSERTGTCHDLVHVVRCRDCKYCMSYWKSDYCDYFSHVTNDPDGFCAWGERKESE